MVRLGFEAIFSIYNLIKIFFLVCGISNKSSRRIINGKDTIPHTYPWMLVLYTANNQAYCGASLISDRHVITAGHCFSFE